MAQAPSVITVSLNPAIDRIVEVPRFTIGEHQRGRLISRTPAGKAVNVSRVLAALGVESVATGFVGEEEVELFSKSLDPARVQARFLPVAGRTRENITIVDPAVHVDTHIRDAGFTVSEADRGRLGERLGSLCGRDDIIVFAGSVPEGIDAAQFVELATICTAAGARVVLDTSGPPLRAAAKLPLWLMKPNVIEMGEIAGRSLETEAELLKAGCELAQNVRTVIISRGKAGGLCFADGAVLRGHVPLDPARVRNTVGCGDSHLAAFIAGWLRYGEARDAYRYALAVATAAAMSVETCRFDVKDVDECLSRAVVERL